MREETARPGGAGGEGLGAGRLFRTTSWSVVLAAGGAETETARQALERLCQSYWYPLYCCVRRHGCSPEDAQDCVQAFLAKLLKNKQLALADPDRGRFRTFLLRSLENFLRSRHRDATTQKRGGGRETSSLDAQTAEERYASEPANTLSPERLFERQWGGAVLENVLQALRREFLTSGREELFDALEPHLWGDEDSTPYATIGGALNMTAVAVRVTLHRLRQRFQALLREEIVETLENPAEIEDELRALRRALAT